MRETNEVHLGEMELACSKGEFEASFADHLRWCAQCRSLAAEYRWLGEQLTDALASVSEVVPVARPKWRAVKRRIVVGPPAQESRLARLCYRQCRSGHLYAFVNLVCRGSNRRGAANLARGGGDPRCSSYGCCL